MSINLEKMLSFTHNQLNTNKIPSHIPQIGRNYKLNNKYWMEGNKNSQTATIPLESNLAM